MCKAFITYFIIQKSHLWTEFYAISKFYSRYLQELHKSSYLKFEFVGKPLSDLDQH
jgi:hypothetical protein